MTRFESDCRPAGPQRPGRRVGGDYAVGPAVQGEAEDLVRSERSARQPHAGVDDWVRVQVLELRQALVAECDLMEVALGIVIANAAIAFGLVRLL